MSFWSQIKATSSRLCNGTPCPRRKSFSLVGLSRHLGRKRSPSFFRLGMHGSETGERGYIFGEETWSIFGNLHNKYDAVASRMPQCIHITTRNQTLRAHTPSPRSSAPPPKRYRSTRNCTCRTRYTYSHFLTNKLQQSMTYALIT